MENNKKIITFDTMGIQECQRNRYPLLFIDKIVEAVPGEYAKAVKNFTFNEWFFPAHFDDDPNVPGFVQIEALAQTFLMTFLSIEEYKGQIASALGYNNIKFKRKIVPGDTLEITATLDSFRRGIAKGHVESFVDGEPAASLEITVGINSVFEQFKPKSDGSKQ